MTATEYGDVLTRATRLPHREKTDLLAELANQVRDTARTEGTRDIMELEGLGAEIWEGIDAQEYIDRERASWNG